MTVRVRFAPSPTGHLHIGGVRTAIFNWLFARHHDGTFLIRIEDTDRERSKPEYVTSIVHALEWLGLASDEPLVYQSQRTDLYQKLISQLVTNGRAYKCYCTPQELEARCKQGDFMRYDGYCKTRDPQPDDATTPFVVRFALPEKSAHTFDDLIRGTVSVDAQQLDDFIIARSDGSPMYNFVVVADDHAMGITHVIRGEDHIANTPKQIALYQALGYPVPKFAHIPLILGPLGNRLSKRDAAVSVLDYKTSGYLPDALFNYLVRLGWSHGDQEIFTRPELVTYFTLDAVGKSGAKFDVEKLNWMNGVYLRELSAAQIIEAIQKQLDIVLHDYLPLWSIDQEAVAVDLYKGRVATLQQLVDELVLLHRGPDGCPPELDQVATAKTKEYVEQILQQLKTLEPFDAPSIKKTIKEFCKQHNIKLPEVLQPIRLALTGTTSSPGVFELLALLKKEESSSRLRALCACLT